MQELERLYTGASRYTVSCCGGAGNFAAYFGNFSCEVFQIRPFRHVCTVPAPLDLVSDGRRESSGIACIDVSPSGELALVSRLGTLVVYELQRPQQALFSLSLAGDRRTDKEAALANRRDTDCLI